MTSGVAPIRGGRLFPLFCSSVTPRRRQSRRGGESLFPYNVVVRKEKVVVAAARSRRLYRQPWPKRLR